MRYRFYAYLEERCGLPREQFNYVSYISYVLRLGRGE